MREPRTLRVLATGPLALVEDLGRPGQAEIGVGRSGAADRASLRQGNRAIGNHEGAAALEATLGGLEVEVGGRPLWCCVTGAPGEVSVDGRGTGSHTILHAPAGSRIRIASPRQGLRSYLCVRGGIEVPAVLGSRSRDVMAALGPAPLEVGHVLPVGEPSGPTPGIDQLPWPRLDDPAVLRVVRGPRDDWLADADVLTTAPWRASERSNRVGIRLTGTTLAGAGRGELPSEGAWRGAVQVPPSGEPVLLVADHPVTGGYPVVGVVVEDDVDRAAQLRPGQRLRFRWVGAP